MNWGILINSKIVENLGWTLAHSVWQIGLIWLVLFFVLRVLRRSPANARYISAILALALAAILPIFTFVQITENSSPKYFQAANAKDVSVSHTNKKTSPPEIFLDFAGTEITPVNKENKNIFAAVEISRRIFAENFAAVSPFVVALWLFGIIFFAVRLTGGVWQLHIYKTRGIFEPNDEWRARFLVVCEKLKIKQSVTFLQSNLIESPIAVGILKPFILIPASLFLQISPAQLETVIAHELIHIRRRDALVNFAQSIIEVLFFYHPCVWFISSVIRREREFATDESVVETMENSHIVYASALANLEEIRQTAKQTLSPLAAAANGGNLMQRITKILNKNTEIEQSSSAWSAGLALMLISAVLLTVFSFTSGAGVNAQTAMKNKKIAVGFVSIAPNNREKSDKNFDETAVLLIEKLTARRIPAIGFVSGASISPEQNVKEKIDRIITSLNEASNNAGGDKSFDSDKTAQMRLTVEKLRAQQSQLEKIFTNRANTVRIWIDAGLEVGIGGFRHIWFHDNSVEEFIANTEKNERVVRQILAEKNLQLRYFSYPFLNTGKSADDRAKFESWLASRDLAPVKYTIDNQEWMYSFAYDAARKNNDLNKMNEVRREFLDYMTKMFDHYEAYSQEMFGRDIAQTMVLTPSRLVADTADEFFGMIEKRGYRFVSMDEALKDEAYQSPEAMIESKSGISWFERWQLAQNKNLRAEPKVSQFVEDLWNNRSEKNPPPAPPLAPEAPLPPPALPIPPAPPKLIELP
jgi:beta-lactamase regulating signal transducer with metallopeptidase domain/peptidoglycan/xylan/chitin deacetylase (PgdA/CDA1 family)